MNIRKALVEQIVKDLGMRFKKAQWDLISNRRKIQELAAEQKRLKKTCSEIGSLMNELRKSTVAKPTASEEK